MLKQFTNGILIAMKMDLSQNIPMKFAFKWFTGFKGV
jgi:hypothetical protein